MSIPFADLSPCFVDPEISDRILVLRRTDGLNEVGRSVPRIAARYETFAVVTAASPEQLRRLPDQEHQEKTISIATRFRLQGPQSGQQPDQIVWHNDTYVIISLDDLTGFGIG